MTITPNTAELYSAQIPALAVLVSLGWEYVSPAACLDMRGGNHGVLARSAGPVSTALTGTGPIADAHDRRIGMGCDNTRFLVGNRNTGAYSLSNRTLHASAPACAPGGSFFAFFTSCFKGCFTGKAGVQ